MYLFHLFKLNQKISLKDVENLYEITFKINLNYFNLLWLEYTS